MFEESSFQCSSVVGAVFYEDVFEAGVVVGVFDNLALAVGLVEHVAGGEVELLCALFDGFVD